MRISDWSSDVCSSDLALWQWLAVGVARDLHRRERFDCVHHVTYAGLRIPSFMGRLGVRFVFGPVGGGESAPWRLRWGYSLGGLLSSDERRVGKRCVGPSKARCLPIA